MLVYLQTAKVSRVKFKLKFSVTQIPQEDKLGILKKRFPVLTILNENQLRQIFTCKRSPYFLFSVYVILPLSLLACLSYTYLSTSLLYFIYSSLSFFFFSSTQISPFHSFCLFSLLDAFLSSLENFYLNALQGKKKNAFAYGQQINFNCSPFFFFLKNTPLILCTMFPVYFLLSSVLDTITKWKPLSVKTLKTSHFIFQ